MASRKGILSRRDDGSAVAARHRRVRGLERLPGRAPGPGRVLICLWYTFYTGYYPYMTDLASPGVPDAMLTLLVLLALDCFRLGDLGLGPSCWPSAR